MPSSGDHQKEPLTKSQAPRRLRIWDLAEQGHNPSHSRITSADEVIGSVSRTPPCRDGFEAADFEKLYEVCGSLNLKLATTFSTAGIGEVKCRSKTLSPATATFEIERGNGPTPIKAPQSCLIGREAHLNIETIGPVRGLVTSENSSEFSVAIDPASRDVLRERLSNIARESCVEFADSTTQFSVTRIEPQFRKCIFSCNTGAMRQGKIVNFSQIDILIRTAIIPARNSHIIFRGEHVRLATVTRSFETGFSARFAAPILADEFSASMKFS